jgi:hypothetical protein
MELPTVKSQRSNKTKRDTDQQPRDVRSKASPVEREGASVNETNKERCGTGQAGVIVCHDTLVLLGLCSSEKSIGKQLSSRGRGRTTRGRTTERF